MLFEVIYKVKAVKNDSWHSIVFKTEEEANSFIKKAESEGYNYCHLIKIGPQQIEKLM